MRARPAACLLAGVLALTSCGAGTSATATTSTSSSSAATSTSTATASSAAKVSANNAAAEGLVAAFTAAGVSNPDRWAREVQEYRPYETTDTDFARLRQELAKYNPAAGSST